jgi:hypothetical protein
VKTNPNNKWSNFEGLDRCSMVLSHLQTAFLNGEHPALDTYEKAKLYHKAVEALADLYQKIGEKEFEDAS